MKINKFLSAIAAGTSLIFSSCYDLDRVPDYQLSSNSFFKNETHAKEALMGVYAQMQNDNVYGYAFGWDCMGGISCGYDNPSFLTIQRGTVATNAGYFSNKWAALYEGVARANSVLQNIDNCDMSDELIAQYKGEARFMRGLYYFNLLNFYGGVPLYDESVVVGASYSEMKEPRSTAEQVREFILKDFEAALSLPKSWDAANAGRATWGAAMSMKGKVLLYAKRYKEASECFKQVINSGLYQLYPNYADLFRPNKGDESSEMIFAIQNLGGVGQDIGMPMTFYLGSRASFGSCWNNIMPATSYVDSFEWKDGRPFNWDEVIPGYNDSKDVKAETYYATLSSDKKTVVKYPDAKETLLAMYEQRDPRMMAEIILPYTWYTGWYANANHESEFVIVKGNAVNDGNHMIRSNGTREYYLWRKFVAEGNWNGLINNRADTPVNYPLVRYADLLLMQAECLNELDDQPGAVSLINQVRGRVGMALINNGDDWMKATTKEEVFARIRHERSVELGCEGHSYDDLKRWGLLEELNGRVEYYFTGAKADYTRKVIERDYLWPIPTGEIEKNESLTQNPGW